MRLFYADTPEHVSWLETVLRVFDAIIMVFDRGTSRHQAPYPPRHRDICVIILSIQVRNYYFDPEKT